MQIINGIQNTHITHSLSGRIKHAANQSVMRNKIREIEWINGLTK